MAIAPPMELKLMIKRFQYKHAKSERRKTLIIHQAKKLKRSVR